MSFSNEEFAECIADAIRKKEMSEDEFKRYKDKKYAERKAVWGWKTSFSLTHNLTALFVWVSSVKKYREYLDMLLTVDLDFIEIQYKKIQSKNNNQNYIELK